MGVKYLTRSIAVLLLLLFLFVGLWSEGHRCSLARSELRSFDPIRVEWVRPGMYNFTSPCSSVMRGKVRVGEQVTVAWLSIYLDYMNFTILDRIELTFRIFLNRETDYVNRSRAIIIESCHTYHWSGETFQPWVAKLSMTFNETLKFGDQITQVNPGQELRLKSWWELDGIFYYKNQSVKTMFVGGSGGYTEIIVENLQNPMLTYFLETDAKIMGQAGTVFISATAVILWKAKGKVRENKRNFILTIILVFTLTFIVTFLIIPGIPILA